MGVDEVRLRLGSPDSDRLVGRNHWIVYSRDEWRLRLRGGSPGVASASTIRSWTLDLTEGFPDLPAALEAFGLRATSPIEAPSVAAGGMLRCEICARQRPASLTARIAAGRVVALSAFDEPPDWIERSAR